MNSLSRQFYGMIAALLLLLAACGPSATPTPSGPYTVDQSGPAAVCSVSQRPELSVAGQEIHASADAASEVLGILPVGHWIAVTQRTDDGWYQVSLPDTPVDGGWIQRGGVLLEQPCSCYPGCARFVPQGPVNEITTCNLVLPAGTTYTIYYQPDVTSNVFATISDGVEAMAVARTTDGWIGFDPGVAQADNIGMDRLRWVQVPTDAVVLDGTACDALPVYTYEPINTTG